ncbi:hypothetical protein T01_14012 [Trichinella spiralis]|uniref:Uncharacterized protein n=1 Tax=Trichinella spiralis TaxID=6334 RepID=A0A0V1APG9_TRISP|nr:hypothetical protein T01_14012 [Trichinella spiralis]
MDCNCSRFRRQSSSVRTNPDNVLVLVAVSAFPICGLRHPMKLVPFATRVRIDVKAFPSRPSVPIAGKCECYMD